LIVDLDTGKPIVTFQGRRADEVVAWFRSRPQEELARVEVVVLDMSKTYFGPSKRSRRSGAGHRPLSRVQQAVDALDAVLSAVKKQRDTDEAKELKKLRKRWLKSSSSSMSTRSSRVTTGSGVFPRCARRLPGTGFKKMVRFVNIINPALEALLKH